MASGVGHRFLGDPEEGRLKSRRQLPEVAAQLKIDAERVATVRCQTFQVG
jgi:hypothetical protein